MTSRNLVPMLVGGIGLALAIGCSSKSSNPPPVVPAAKLTLTLDPTLDGGGAVKATSFTKLELVSTAGTVIKTLAVTGTSASVDLATITAGDYFLRVNDLADDLVPTRIDDPSKNLSQSVGTKLRASLIGPPADPVYRVKSYSKGQLEHAMVKYGDGTVAPPERYTYAIVSFKTTPQKMEIRIAPTGVLVVEKVKSASDPHAFATWALGETNHGKPANYVTDASCNTCHGSLDAHPTQYASVSPTNGWCFNCHYGKVGDPNGFVDKNFDVPAQRTLTLTLDPALDAGGIVKATAFTTAELLDTTGAKIVDGVVGTPATTATFALPSASTGHYFIRVNGLADDLVPTYVADLTASPSQTVGTKLRSSVIGPTTDPSYKLKTYSLGQGESVLKQWSNGAAVSPAAYGYAFLSLKTTTKFFETRVLGTAALLVRKDASAVTHTAGQGTGVFGDWLLGSNNHGKALNYVSDASCLGCHGSSLDTKPATYTATTATAGWCFKCHNGKTGDPAGLIDPAK